MIIIDSPRQGETERERHGVKSGSAFNDDSNMKMGQVLRSGRGRRAMVVARWSLLRAGIGAKGEVKKMERATRDIRGFGFEGGVWILVWVWAVCMKCLFCTWKARAMHLMLFSLLSI